jgi:TorA maturation chaperone TorD
VIPLSVYENVELEPFELLGEELAGEALLFGLLGKLLYQEPDRQWLAELVRDGVFEEAPFGMGQKDVQRGLSLLQDWGRLGNGSLPEPVFKDLQSDYFSLFVGAGKVLAPPWESVYFSEERLLFQEQTLAVRAWYRRFGLEIEKLHQEPDDHLGLELAFLAHLASLGLAELERQDSDGVEAILNAQRNFVQQHLLRWEGEWSGLVLEHARTDFYRGLARLTHGALRALAIQLELSVPLEIDS